MKFIVDSMHGKLAKKMRIYGYDTLYNAYSEDNTVLELAEKEDRIIITSDTALFERALSRRIPSIKAPLDDDVTRMAEIFKILKLKPELNSKKSRCSLCNTPLVEICKSQITSIPENVLRRKKIFYQCPKCGKIYWKGSHWKEMREFESMLKKKIKHS